MALRLSMVSLAAGAAALSLLVSCAPATIGGGVGVVSQQSPASVASVQPPPDAIVAKAPDLRIGDRWVYRNPNNRNPDDKIVEEVVQTGTDGSYRVRSAGVASSMGSSFRSTGVTEFERSGRIRSADTTRTVDGTIFGTLTTKFDTLSPWGPSSAPGNIPVSFPLWHGKRWTVTLSWPGGGLFGPAERSIDLLYVVDRYEEIEVPAGRFMAYRIVRGVVRGRTLIPHDDLFPEVAAYWYAPEAGSIIRTDSPDMDNETNRDLGIRPYGSWLVEANRGPR